jgi:hypothetical protein
VVEFNDILCENPLADGIVLAGGEQWGGAIDSSIIQNNAITLADTGYGGVTLIDNVSSSYIGQNRFAGAADYAVGMFPSGLVENFWATDNAIVGNNWSQLDTLTADVLLLFSPVDTLLRGNGGTVLDYGQNSSITGSTMRDAPTGRDYSRPLLAPGRFAGETSGLAGR